MVHTNDYSEGERAALPVYQVRQQLITRFKQNPTSIVLGETGSGKSTQIPQMVFRSGLAQGGKKIAVTQPRRLAAITLAKRVALEMDCEIGKKVGYHVRFEQATSMNTYIVYMTDGILLREAVNDPQLKQYSVIILDEAHERSVRTDILFALVKKAQQRRPHDLKVIVMSATMDVDMFSIYFGNAPVFYVEGRQHPIDIFHVPTPHDDYVYAALVTIFQLHRTTPANEGVLVFLPGTDEIDALVRRTRELSKEAHHMDKDIPKMEVVSLFAALSAQSQNKVFDTFGPNTRKVVISTNIAETSVTIPGIKHVVDSCRVKARNYQPSKGIEMLRIVRISKDQAFQRAGRAGREGPGCCYRLVTKAEFDSFAPSMEPDIKRTNLSSVVLELMSAGVTNVFSFNYMDRPSEESLTAAIRELYQLGAIESIDDNHNLHRTTIGQKMADFPLDPKLSRVLIAANEIGCLDDALSVVALISIDQSIFAHVTKEESRLKCEEARRKFVNTAEGDLMTQLAIFRSFRRQSGGAGKNWCMDNFVHQRNLQQAENIRRDLAIICTRNKMNMAKSYGGDGASQAVRRALCYGLFLHTAELESANRYVVLDSGSNASIHPSSCLAQHNPTTVIYTELVMTSKCYIKDVTVVDPAWLKVAAPHYFDLKRLKS